MNSKETQRGYGKSYKLNLGLLGQGFHAAVGYRRRTNILH